MVLRRTHFKKHHTFLMMVLMRTAPRISHKSPGKLVVLLRTAARFSQEYFFKKHPSGGLAISNNSVQVQNLQILSCSFDEEQRMGK